MVQLWGTWFDYDVDEVLAHPGDGRLAVELRRWALLRRALRDFDVVHFNFGSSILPAAAPPAGSSLAARAAAAGPVAYARVVGLRDLALLARAGKRIVVTYNGDDARQGTGPVPDFHRRLAAAAGASYYTEADDARKRRAIAAFDRHARRIFYVNPDLGAFLPERAEFMPYGHVDVRVWPAPGVAEGGGPPVVVHAPSHRGIKGTRFVVEAVDRLRADGVELDFRLLEGMPHSDAVRAYAEADILVDQLLVGWYGGVAVEFMALGKPVVCFVAEEWTDRYAPAGMMADLPIVRAGPEDLAGVLSDLVSRPRPELAEPVVAAARSSSAGTTRCSSLPGCATRTRNSPPVSSTACAASAGRQATAPTGRFSSGWPPRWRKRGPDGQGVWHDDAVGLAFRRLAIIDLDERSNQPLHLGPWHLVFNGEIYNYRELRDELRGLGHAFVTEGDGEVLLHAWAEWGEGALERVNGDVRARDLGRRAATSSSRARPVRREAALLGARRATARLRLGDPGAARRRTPASARRRRGGGRRRSSARGADAAASSGASSPASSGSRPRTCSMAATAGSTVAPLLDAAPRRGARRATRTRSPQLRELLTDSIRLRLRSRRAGRHLAQRRRSTPRRSSRSPAQLAGDHRRHAFTAALPGLRARRVALRERSRTAAGVVEHHAVEPTRDAARRAISTRWSSARRSRSDQPASTRSGASCVPRARPA